MSSLLALALLAALPAAPPLPAGAELLHRTAPEAPAGVTVGLVLRDRAALDALIAAQHDPRSPSYRRWLSPAGFGAQFGLSEADYQAVVHAFEAAGLEVRRYPDRLVLQARGQAGQLERLLGIRFYEAKSGATRFRTFQGTPHLAGAAGAWVQSIAGLDTRIHAKRRVMASTGYATLGPQDLRRYYSMDALHAQGYAGQLSEVAVLGPIPDPANRPDPANLSYFFNHLADAAPQVSVLDLPNPNNVIDTQGDKEELEMDAELSAVGAPLERRVTVVLAPGDQMYVAGPAYIVNLMPGLTSISISYGNCEAEEDPVEPITMANLIAQGAAEGQAWFAASGDDGADDCLDESGPAVDFPGTIPYMVSVGGTEYTGSFDALGAVQVWGSERTWNSGANGGGAGGGGVSSLFFQPLYQLLLPHPKGHREVPDFSLHASPDPGVAVVDTYPGFVDSSGGTSDSAPLAAGIFALLNDAIGGCRVGAPHFELYALGAAQFGAGGPAVFHDITQGNLNQNGVTGPSAAAGFDDATGWGSLDVSALAQAWPPCLLSGSPSGPAFLPDGGLPLDDAGLYDPGPFDAGAALDAGPRAAYDPCAVLACDGGATCVTPDSGPSACVLACAADGGCPAGQLCDDASATCIPGCQSDTDCASGQTCFACGHRCVYPGADGGAVGSTCESTSDCPAGGTCFTADYDGYPDGYCSLDCDPSAAPGATCSCPAGSACSPYGHCFTTCSVSEQTGCRTGYTCWDLRQGDLGECRPPCTSDTDCDFDTFQNHCDSRGVCVNPNPTTATASSSSGSTGSTSSTGSTGSTASASSATGSTGSTGAGSTGSTGSTGGATTTGGASDSSGSTGRSCPDGAEFRDGVCKAASNPVLAQKGCGCGTGAGLDGLFGLALAALLRRRRDSGA